MLSASVPYQAEGTQVASPTTLPSLAVVMAYSDMPRLLPLRFARAILIACGFEFQGWWGILDRLWVLREARSKFLFGVSGNEWNSL